MMRNTVFAVVLSAIASIGYAGNEDFRIVGYLPSYRMDSINPEWGKYLTDLIYFSGQPNKDGTMDLSDFKPDAHKKLLALKKKHGFRYLFCLGGWGKSAHFAHVATDAGRRKKFIAEVTKFCLEQGFDGIDYDWEFPRGAAQHKAYSDLLVETKKAFKPHKLQVSVAIGSTKRLCKEAYAALDMIHIMSYDHGGRHSTYAHGVADVAHQKTSGADPKKICLGVPFYGRKLKKWSEALAYSELKMRDSNATGDEIDGYFFNNAATIRKKTKLALDNKLGGIMIWEIGQDAIGNDSLLKVIHDTVKAAKK